MTERAVDLPSDGLLCLRVLGEVVGVRFAGPEPREQVRAAWSRCVVPTPRGRVRTIRSEQSDLPLTRPLSHRLAYDLTDLGIDLLSGRAVLLHAAGLSRPDGSVVALVAASGTGKTTAAARLARGGFGYVTDETVAVLEDGTVPPFPKPLSLVVDPDVEDDKVHVGPDQLGLAPCPERLHLAAVVLLERDPGLSGPPWLERLHPLEAVTQLVGHTSALTRLPRPLVSLAALAADGAGVHRAHYSEAEDLEPLLHALLDAPSAPTPPVPPVVLPVDLPVDLTDRSRMPSGRDPAERLGYVRAPVADGIRTRDGAVLLVGTDPVRLSPLGLTLWDAVEPVHDPAAGPVSLADVDDLVEAAEREHGPHPQARELVGAALDALVAAGVLVRT
ncbi:hypothetical protein GCM10009721_06970 [Terrabacter tumescens]|uniref:PqqD family peptide modification chaperone n=1 Tax=Terrabacter tumescens TaxID=60443 RepID=A0ABQ2HPS0_9MICO|nr:hypothetical protein [Terrabacter tumescens]GGM84836.1 hypothetical protein GCM10009721_06970 [Terrabacter tumescens]